MDPDMKAPQLNSHVDDNLDYWNLDRMILEGLTKYSQHLVQSGGFKCLNVIFVKMCGRKTLLVFNRYWILKIQWQYWGAVGAIEF